MAEHSPHVARERCHLRHADMQYLANESALCVIYYTTLCSFWINRLLTLFEETAAQAAPLVIMAALTVGLIKISAHLIEQIQHLFAHPLSVVQPKGVFSIAQQSIGRR